MVYDQEVLNENSKRYESLIEYFFSQDLFLEHILQNGHLALELKAKAYLKSKNIVFPETHDLTDIFGKTSNTLPKGLWGLISSQSQYESYKDAYKKVKTAWNMNNRYSKWKYKERDLKTHYTHYKEVIKWLNSL